MSHEAFRIELQACDPARNHRRYYLIDVGRDLFGDLTVRFHYGWIGSRGRTKTQVVPDATEAAKLVRRCLRRRQSAPKRIGVAYQVRAKYDPAEWVPV
jgi:predicted DNA-binding WGR domain protein